MTKRKKNNYNIKQPKTAKVPHNDTDPDCLYSYRAIPLSQAVIDKMVEDLREWPEKNPDAKFIRAFYRERGISEKTYYKLLLRDKNLKEAHEEAMAIIGERLWGRSVDKQAHWPAVQFLLHKYSPDMKEAVEFNNQLAQKQLESTNFKIQMIEVPSSPLVPKKKESEDE